MVEFGSTVCSPGCLMVSLVLSHGSDRIGTVSSGSAPFNVLLVVGAITLLNAGR